MERMKVSPAASVRNVTFSLARAAGAGVDGGRQRRRGEGGCGRGREGKAGIDRIQEAADGRSGDGRGLVDRLIPGDGVAELLARHKRRHKGVARRIGERARGAGEGGERIDRRHLLDPEGDAQEQPRGRHAGGGVGERRHQPPVIGVGRVAGEKGEDKRGSEGEQPGQAERPGALRHVVDEQADGHGLGLPPENHGKARGAEEAKVAGLESGPAGRGLGHARPSPVRRRPCQRANHSARGHAVRGRDDAATNVSRLSWPAHEAASGVNHAGGALTIHRSPQGARARLNSFEVLLPPPLTRLAFIKMVCPP